ncbi:hypothetical protein EV363DRAFT_1400464 [Boletus edulis]|nr:hypothetical protein EV363DRAFT_1400464 [Boletus edulis]
MKLVNSVGGPRFSVWTKQDTNNASNHQTLYNLANYLGALAMITVVAYHFVAVNARHVAQTH